MKLTPLNITRIKNVSNKEKTPVYMDWSSQNFILHYPDRLSKSVLNSGLDEIIAIYQTIKNIRYFTHLVIPVDLIKVEENIENYRFGRKVKVLAFTGDENKMTFKKAKISGIKSYNRGWGRAEKITDIVGSIDVEKYQQDLWNIFRPYFREDIKKNDDEFQYLEKDLVETSESESTVEEGRLKLINHFIRERNKSIIRKKKQLALKKNEYFCQVCNFSFLSKFEQEYIECHHVEPIANGEIRDTTLNDLALVCSNCHSMLHRKFDNKYLSIDELKTVLE